MDDSALAAQLAEDAGAALLALQARHIAAATLGERLKELGDGTSQDLLSRALAIHRPDDAVLSEEARDDPARTAADRVWIIDPLDGTREFSEGRNDWAVHVALWERGQLVAGAVALPPLHLTLNADDGPKLWPDPQPLRIAVSRSRPTTLVMALADEIGAELVPMGSAGYKACAVVRGEVDAYVHSGGQYEWDSAAPVAVARGAGLHTSRIDGAPLAYNLADPYLPDLLICNPHLTDLLLTAVRTYSEQEKS